MAHVPSSTRLRAVLLHDAVSGVTVETDFTDPVPGVLWLPPASPTRLVLLGHGGSGHKRAPRIVSHAEWFAARGVAAMALDGPFHGDRVPTPLTAPEYQALAVARGPESVLDQIAGDWLAAISTHLPAVRNIGYMGFSLGARYGLPTAVALGDRLRCLVIGKFGLQSTMPPGLDAPHRIRADAARLTAPTMLHAQWDDTLFPRAGAFELFDVIGAADKRLIAFPGEHGGNPPDAHALWREFMLAHL